MTQHGHVTPYCSGYDFQCYRIQKVTAMAQRAIREVDGKRLLAQWMKDAWDIGFGVEALDGMTARQAFTVEGPTVNWTALADAYVAVASIAITRAARIIFLCTCRHPWVNECPLVVKPDQLIKRRGKAGLLGLNVDWLGVQQWVSARMNENVTVDGVTGPLTHFIVEPFVPHASSDEYYVCIQSDRAGEEVLFYHEVCLQSSLPARLFV